MGAEQTERRSPCVQHGKVLESLSSGETRMQAIEDKIDTMLARQMDYMASQMTVSTDITRIKTIVENGLRKNVEELSIAAMAVHDKVELLDDFAWFIKTVNGFRDGLMKKIIMVSMAGGVLVVLYSTLSAISAREMPKLLSRLLG